MRCARSGGGGVGERLDEMGSDGRPLPLSSLAVIYSIACHLWQRICDGVVLGLTPASALWSAVPLVVVLWSVESLEAASKEQRMIQASAGTTTQEARACAMQQTMRKGRCVGVGGRHARSLGWEFRAPACPQAAGVGGIQWSPPTLPLGTRIPSTPSPPLLRLEPSW